MTDRIGTDLGSVLSALADLSAEEAADGARSDQHRRWSAGERVPVEAYLAALPAVAADPEQAMVLVYGEVLARAARGESPTLGEYRARFPQWAERLEIQFHLHAALGSGSAPPSTFDPDSTLPPTPGPTDPDAPDTIGPYRVLGVLGRGGMGVVYAAWDSTLNREVAVKTIRAGGRSPLADRFVRESMVTARLPHPAIPPVHALGQLPDGTPYLVMKLVRGGTLQVLADRPDIGRWLSAYEAVCHAVGFAHAQGVVHRDLKPANVMVGDFGEVQVMDWGLARILGERRDVSPPVAADTTGPDFTIAGSVLGTPAYMAPEQARGEPADARADVFALGGLLTFLLTGEPTFSARAPADALRMARHGDTAPAVARLDASGADAELVALAKRCLSGSPDDRPADGAAVAAAVAEYRAGVEQRLRTAEQARAAADARAIEQRKRRRVQLALAGTVALLLAVVGGVAWWRDHEAGVRERDRLAWEAEQADRRRRAEDGLERGLAQAVELRRKGLWGQAERALDQAEPLAADTDDAAWPARLRDARGQVAAVRELEHIALDWNEVGRGTTTLNALRRRFEAAFRKLEIDLRDGDPGAASRAVAASPLASELLAALNGWWAFEPDAAFRDRLRQLVRAVPATDAKLPATVELLRSAEMAASGEDAAAPLRAGLIRHPTDFWLLAFLAREYERRRDFARAAEVCRALRAIRPESHDVCDGLAMMAFEMGDLNAAEAHCRESLRLADTALATDYLARVLFFKKDIPAALTAHRAAVGRDPNNAVIRNNYGSTLRFAGQFPDAVAEFRAAVAAEPKTAKYRLNLASALRIDLKRPADAKAVLEEVRIEKLATEPADRRRLASELAEAYRATGEPARAVALLTEARAEFPADAPLALQLGKCLLYDARDPRAAEKVLADAVRLAPGVANAQTEHGQARLELGDVPGALARHAEAARLAPADWRVWYRAGWALVAAGSDDDAWCAFGRVAALVPERADGFAALGNRAMARKDYAGAADWLRVAVAKPGADATAFNQAGLAFARLRDWAAAAPMFARATELAPKWASPWEMLALTRQTLGEWDAALVAYRRAIDLNPQRGAAFRNEVEKIEEHLRSRREPAPPPRPVKE